mgnify:FL=1
MKSLKEQIQDIETEVQPWLRESERLRADPTVSIVDAMRPLQVAYWFYYKKLNKLLENFKSNKHDIQF